MAVEALSQVSDGHEEQTYHLRNISLLAALSIPSEGDIEMFLHMKPSRLSDLRSSKNWFEFWITSVKETVETVHCRGNISATQPNIPSKYELTAKIFIAV
jgi:hypothetical protein